MEDDRITKFLGGKTYLITGGTGFLGKALIEKLLRSIPDIEKIYILVRAKKGKDPNQRLEQIFGNPIFNLLKEQQGADYVYRKCQIIGGDVEAENLGLSEKDKLTLINEVNIIYHCAATIRFDESLKKAVLLNARGTKLAVELAKLCKNLLLFAHVSTAYCHLSEKLLLEKPYPPPKDPEKIIQTVLETDDRELELMTPNILGTLPNTYAFSKALGEDFVVKSFDSIPSIIIRPSIVIPTYKEPMPGWTDNINGPTGLLIGAGKGVIRTMYCNSDSYGDFLPVDFAVNALLVITWNFIANKDYDRRINNLVSSAEIKVSWEEIVTMGRWIVSNRIPLNGVLWYPGGSMKKSRLLHQICMVLFHWIPAILIDILLFCLGYKPVLCRVHRRIQKGFEIFEYYANNQWDFDNTNVREIRKLINNTERIKYKMDGEGVDIMQYFEDCIKAARILLLKETDDQIPAARRHMRIMWWVDKICKTTIVSLFIYYVGGFILSLLLSCFN